MKKINTYITEKLKIRKLKHNIKYRYFPKTKKELKDLLKQLIEERGNEGDFNDIDVSNVTDMSMLFKFMEEFNGNISKWDVSNVTNMISMFHGSVFNSDISKWDVSNVRNMKAMFDNCPIEEKYKPKFKK